MPHAYRAIDLACQAPREAYTCWPPCERHTTPSPGIGNCGGVAGPSARETALHVKKEPHTCTCAPIDVSPTRPLVE